jgi:hypothetical protein
MFKGAEHSAQKLYMIYIIIIILWSVGRSHLCICVMFVRVCVCEKGKLMNINSYVKLTLYKHASADPSIKASGSIYSRNKYNLVDDRQNWRRRVLQLRACFCCRDTRQGWPVWGSLVRRSTRNHESNTINATSDMSRDPADSGAYLPLKCMQNVWCNTTELHVRSSFRFLRKFVPDWLSFGTIRNVSISDSDRRISILLKLLMFFFSSSKQMSEHYF